MLSFIIIFLILLICIFLLFGYKTLTYLPVREVERRRIKGDRVASILSTSNRYRKEIEGLIVIKLIVLIAIFLLIIARTLPVWFGALAIVSFIILTLFLIGKKPGRFVLRIGVWIIRLYTKFFKKFKSYIPLKTLARVRKDNKHSGIYDLEDLDDLIRRQLEQEDNRIIEDDLTQISNILSLRKIYVDEAMTKIKEFPVIRADDLVTPVVIDEIHKIKGSYLPVLNKDDDVIGFVNKNRLGLGSEGRIKDYVDFITEKVNYGDNLYQVIEKLVADNSYSLPVYNLDILVGIIDLGAILRWLINISS